MYTRELVMGQYYKKILDVITKFIVFKQSNVCNKHQTRITYLNAPQVIAKDMDIKPIS